MQALGTRQLAAGNIKVVLYLKH